MTDRPAFLTALVIGTALLFAGDSPAVLVPCDAQAAQIQREAEQSVVVQRTSPSFAGDLIAFEESYELGEPIIGRIADLGPDADVGVVIREVVVIQGVEVIGAAEASTRVVGTEVFCWGKPAKYQAELTAAVIEGGKPKRLRGVATFVVGQLPQPPDPDVPDPPEPKPPTGLGALVPDPAHRALLAEFYADFAAEIRKGAGGTTGDFYAAQRKAVSQAQSAGLLPSSLAAINKPISDRITAALGGTADAPLDAAKRTALANALDSIAAEFK